MFRRGLSAAFVMVVLSLILIIVFAILDAHFLKLFVATEAPSEASEGVEVYGYGYTNGTTRGYRIVVFNSGDRPIEILEIGYGNESLWSGRETVHPHAKKMIDIVNTSYVSYSGTLAPGDIIDASSGRKLISGVVCRGAECLSNTFVKWFDKQALSLASTQVDYDAEPRMVIEVAPTRPGSLDLSLPRGLAVLELSNISTRTNSSVYISTESQRIRILGNDRELYLANATLVEEIAHDVSNLKAIYIPDNGTLITYVDGERLAVVGNNVSVGLESFADIESYMQNIVVKSTVTVYSGSGWGIPYLVTCDIRNGTEVQCYLGGDEIPAQLRYEVLNVSNCSIVSDVASGRFIICRDYPTEITVYNLTFRLNSFAGQVCAGVFFTLERRGGSLYVDAVHSFRCGGYSNIFVTPYVCSPFKCVGGFNVAVAVGNTWFMDYYLVEWGKPTMEIPDSGVTLYDDWWQPIGTVYPNGTFIPSSSTTITDKRAGPFVGFPYRVMTVPGVGYVLRHYNSFYGYYQIILFIDTEHGTIGVGNWVYNWVFTSDGHRVTGLDNTTVMGTDSYTTTGEHRSLLSADELNYASASINATVFRSRYITVVDLEPGDVVCLYGIDMDGNEKLLSCKIAHSDVTFDMLSLGWDWLREFQGRIVVYSTSAPPMPKPIWVEIRIGNGVKRFEIQWIGESSRQSLGRIPYGESYLVNVSGFEGVWIEAEEPVSIALESLDASIALNVTRHGVDIYVNNSYIATLIMYKRIYIEWDRHGVLEISSDLDNLVLRIPLRGDLVWITCTRECSYGVVP